MQMKRVGEIGEGMWYSLIMAGSTIALFSDFRFRPS